VKLTPEEAKPGDEVVLSIGLEIPAGSYTYSTNKSFGGNTKFKLQTAGLEALGEFEADHAPKVQYSDEFKQDIEKFKDHVTWSRKFRILPGVTRASIKGKLMYQVCNEQSCRQLAHEIDASVEVATKAPPVFVAEFTPGRGPETPVHLKVELVTEDRLPGSEATLRITARIDKGWHTYSTTQKENNSAQATVLQIDKAEGLKPLDDDFTPDHQPEIKHPQPNTEQEVFHGEVTWSQRYQLTGSLEDVKLSGMILTQACDKDRCLIPTRTKFSLPVFAAAAGPAPAVRGAIGNGEPPKGEPKAGAAESAALKTEDPRAQGLGMFLLTALLAGFAALLTPCVFPMVPITSSPRDHGDGLLPVDHGHLHGARAGCKLPLRSDHNHAMGQRGVAQSVPGSRAYLLRTQPAGDV
jgi:thiol:disulfide interchange protein DsbD